jgi:hypothetical protein
MARVSKLQISKVSVLLLIARVLQSLDFPVELEVLTEEIQLATKLEQNIATFYIRNILGGYLAFGFGINMTNADVFLLQIVKNKIELQNCRLTGFKTPTCVPEGNFKLEIAEILQDGSWEAIVTRDISINIGVTIRSGMNYVIYNYSPALLLESGHNGVNNTQSLAKWYLAEGVASAPLCISFFHVLILVAFFFKS